MIPETKLFTIDVLMNRGSVGLLLRPCGMKEGQRLQQADKKSDGHLIKVWGLSDAALLPAIRPVVHASG